MAFNHSYFNHTLKGKTYHHGMEKEEKVSMDSSVPKRNVFRSYLSKLITGILSRGDETP